MRSLIWFRNDLRVDDNPALSNCCVISEEVIAVYFLTESQWEQHNDSKAKKSFWLRSLVCLEKELQKLNIPLLIIETENYDSIYASLLKLMQQYDCKSLYFNNEYPVNELKRDRYIYKSFKEIGFGVFNYHDQVIHPPGSLKTKAGGNFSVYSPFKRKWFEELTEEQLTLFDIPSPKNKVNIESSDVENISKKFASKIDDLWPVGEEYIKSKVTDFLSTKGHLYKDDRNFPAIDGCSKISPYLNSGVISPKWCILEAKKYNQNLLDEGDRGIVHWVSEILWREFYRHIIYNFPKVSMNRPFLDYTENLEWSKNIEHLQRWKDGKTGIPIVDAGIREMLNTGWMHNRLRMIVAMFLSKNLLIDWREGEKFFMEHLIDGDIASNNGGWQWSASTGTDAAPYFRIMNPETQSIKFDPQGEYIKKWIPELSQCPISEIHMPVDPLKYGYYQPIVDLKKSRQAAIEAFGNLRKD